MGNEIKTWLYDILNAIMEIESFFSDRPKDFINYQNDLRTKRAVERNIEIIGEALNRILKRDMILFQTMLFGELLYDTFLFFTLKFKPNWKSSQALHITN